MPPIKTGDEIWTLPVGAGQFAGRNQPAAKEALLVLTIKHDDFHDQILVLAQEHSNPGMPGAFGHAELLPTRTMIAQCIQGLIQPRQQGLSELIELEEGWFLSPAQSLAFPLDQRKNLLAKRKMLPQVPRDGLGRTYFTATGAAGGRLVALNC